MATAGNLVFQGNAEGRFEAYAADNGEELWSVQTGSAINAAPASYAIDGTQYILIPIGAGGGLQFLYPEMHATKESQGPTRLMAFQLEVARPCRRPAPDTRRCPTSRNSRPMPRRSPKAKPRTPTTASSATARQGRARFGGSVPDLRYANAETHLTWQGIVDRRRKGGERHAGH